MTRDKVIALGVAVAVCCGSVAFVLSLHDAPRSSSHHSSGFAALIPIITLVPVLVATRRRRLEKMKKNG